ncbi:hypothetical protein BKA69DRAFT_675285 [Paraphysoderma sedebokerense]|nr:hypothetical protein BKA69DRAFT_675285 [Paraphysoderma sedebokerense]
MMVNSNVEQDARKALDLLNQCQGLLTAAPKRKGRCEDLKSSIVKDINTIKECQQFSKDINVAVFSKQMGAGKSHIVNSLAIGGDRKYPAMSDVNYGHGVTSIPTRYRYSPTPKFIRHYLSKEQVEERKTLCREWPKMTSNYECNHFINCHVQSIELVGNTKDFFEATWKIQSETLLSELFCILYDEIYFPFELMSKPRYSLMDVSGFLSRIFMLHLK